MRFLEAWAFVVLVIVLVFAGVSALAALAYFVYLHGGVYAPHVLGFLLLTALFAADLASETYRK